jgi:hypothetical protein
MIAGLMMVVVAGCGDDGATQRAAATSCRPSEGTILVDGAPLSCPDPSATATCAASDASCICKRLTGDATETSCTPCALQYPCVDDCQCVADHGTGWQCLVASQGSSPVTHKGCFPPM